MSVLMALLRILQEVTFVPNLGSFLPLQLKERIEIKDANNIAIIKHKNVVDVPERKKKIEIYTF